MQTLTFKEWKANNPELIAQLEENDEDCDECEGRGIHECDCGDQHDCPDCDGSGKVGDHIDDSLQKIYDAQKKQELLKLAKWEGNAKTHSGKE
jgi:DnaJ-class molecular chaperone